MKIDDNDVATTAGHAALRSSASLVKFPRPMEATVKAPVLLTAADVIRSEAFSRPRRQYWTGIPDLDRAIGGLRSRQQSLLAAPTGVGKTGLATTIVRGIAIDGVPVLWFCTELDAEEQAARFAANALRESTGSSHSADDLLRHAVSVDMAANALKGLPIYLYRWRRRLGNPFDIIRDHAKAITAKHGKPPIIVVDYLQKLAVEDEENRRQSVGNVSEQLLEVAQDHDTHMLAISSVSRAYYNATARKLRKQAGEDEDPRDWLAAGKEAGELEYDAALMMYLDVGDEANAVGERPARLIVAKSRQGGEGFYGLQFHGPSGLFIPDGAAAIAMRAPAKAAVVNLDKIKAEVRRVLLKRKTPFTTRSAIADRLGGRRADAMTAIDEMFEAGELSQERKGGPIVRTTEEAGDDV